MATLNQINSVVSTATRNVFSKRQGQMVEKLFIDGEIILTTGDPTFNSVEFFPATINDDGEKVDARFVIYAFINDSGLATRVTFWGAAASFANETLKLRCQTVKLRAWDVKVSELTARATGESFVSLDLNHMNCKALEEPKAFVKKNPFEFNTETGEVANPFA